MQSFPTSCLSPSFAAIVSNLMVVPSKISPLRAFKRISQSRSSVRSRSIGICGVWTYSVSAADVFDTETNSKATVDTQ